VKSEKREKLLSDAAVGDLDGRLLNTSNDNAEARAPAF
jgi:hypothetical protein